VTRTPLGVALGLVGLGLVAPAQLGCAAPPQRTLIANRISPDEDAADQAFAGPITEASLVAMMRTRFAAQLASGSFVAELNGTTADLLSELDAMGIDDLRELARLIPRDYDERAAGDFTVDDPANIPGTLRDLFIIHDARRYFRDAWQNHWASLSGGNLPLYREYHVDLQILVQYGVMSADAIDASSTPPRP